MPRRRKKGAPKPTEEATAPPPQTTWKLVLGGQVPPPPETTEKDLSGSGGSDEERAGLSGPAPKSPARTDVSDGGEEEGRVAGGAILAHSAAADDAAVSVSETARSRLMQRVEAGRAGEVERQVAELTHMKLIPLRRHCRERGLCTAGDRTTLRSRLEGFMRRDLAHVGCTDSDNDSDSSGGGGGDGGDGGDSGDGGGGVEEKEAYTAAAGAAGNGGD